MESDNTTSPEDWDDLSHTTRKPSLMEDQRGQSRSRGVIQRDVPISSARMTPYELAIRAQSRALSRVERRLPADTIRPCEFPFCMSGNGPYLTTSRARQFLLRSRGRKSDK